MILGVPILKHFRVHAVPLKKTSEDDLLYTDIGRDNNVWLV